MGGVKNDITQDCKRHGANFLLNLVHPNFVLVMCYRFSRFFRSKKLFLPLYVISQFIFKVFQYITGIQFSSLNVIGGGLKFYHHGTVVIAGDTIIGENCSIHQGVTLGRLFEGSKAGCPVVGDNVIIFAGAKLLGNISIGDNSVIGANAVVINDVPANAVVAGCPAKIVSDDSYKAVSKKTRIDYFKINNENFNSSK